MSAHAQVREQPVVLEHEADRPPRGLDKGPGARVVDDLPGEHDAAGCDRDQPGQRAEQGGLPGPVRPEHAEHLAGRRGEGGPEGEGAAPDLGVDDEPAAAVVRSGAGRLGHGATPPRSQRSRRETSTMTETSSRTRLSAIAASGSFSSA